MGGFADYEARAALDVATGKTGNLARYLALFTAAPTDAGGGTELAIGTDGYARKQTAGTDFASATGSRPAYAANAVDIVFASPLAQWGPVVAFGAFDASSGGNLLWFDFISTGESLPFVVTAAGDQLQAPAHGLVAGDAIAVTAEYGGTLPAPLQESTLYYVIASGIGIDWFRISATLGGGVIDLTNVKGSGHFVKVLPKTFLTGDPPRFYAGQLMLRL